MKSVCSMFRYAEMFVVCCLSFYLSCVVWFKKETVASFILWSSIVVYIRNVVQESFVGW